jgi:hypothetical protein
LPAPEGALTMKSVPDMDSDWFESTT